MIEQPKTLTERVKEFLDTTVGVELGEPMTTAVNYLVEMVNEKENIINRIKEMSDFQKKDGVWSAH